LIFEPKRIALIEKAVNLNPNQAQYRIILARAYFNEALEEMRKPGVEQDPTKIQNRVAQAINQAKAATEISPNMVAGFETLGMIYREIRLVAVGALEWGIKAFEKATDLEPTNPVLSTELGKLYIYSGQIQKGREKFEKATELKPDYFEVHLQLALSYERENNLPEAIKKMESLVLSYPFNIEASFQLGRLYFNNGQLDEAIFYFKRVLNFLPNHSNALYSLGLAYQKKGQIKEAIVLFEKVLELNPGNIEIQKKLEELKK